MFNELISYVRYDHSSHSVLGLQNYLIVFTCPAMCEIPSNISPHERKLREEKLEEEEDLVDQLLKKSGCTEQHYSVQECMVEHQDWRKCQKVLKDLQVCMSQSQTSHRK